MYIHVEQMLTLEENVKNNQGIIKKINITRLPFRFRLSYELLTFVLATIKYITKFITSFLNSL